MILAADAGGTPAEFPETEIPETEVPEAEIPEAEIPEAEIPEAEIPEAEVPEAEVPEAEIPEAERETKALPTATNNRRRDCCPAARRARPEAAPRRGSVADQGDRGQ